MTFAPCFYLAALMAVTGCMVLCDWRWRLTFFRNSTRAALVAASCVALFLVWDALGIVTGTFFRGDSPYMTGITLAPDMPVEEPIFLFFLTYLTMNLTAGVHLVVDRREFPHGLHTD